MNKISASKRKTLENFAIFIMVILSIFVIVATFFKIDSAQVYLYRYLSMTCMLQRFFGVVLLASAWRLYKRSSLAWNVTVIMIVASICLHIQAQHQFFAIPILCETVALIIFLMFRHDFSRSMNHATLLQGLIVIPVMVILMIINHYIGRFEQLNWVLLFIGLLLIYTPIIPMPKASVEDKEHVLKLCRAYGYNPCAWLALEDDKTYFFGKMVDGVVAYAISRDTMVICGDPICADEDFPVLLAELKNYCDLNNYDMVFLAVSDRYLEVYKRFGFGYVKCGEEPRFKLADYNLKGGKVANVRAEINHARKAGLEIKEYKPLEKREPEIEASFEEISKQWLQTKGGSELIFTLGGVGLDNPNDKRYFYATDETKTIWGFMVFLPFLNGKAYYADVTRRASGSPGGIMELLLYDSFQIMKDSGVEWGSMGLAPLAHLDNPEADRGNALIATILTFVHDHMNSIYGFDSLTKAKEKYNPTEWVPAYFVYSPKIMSPKMALAAVAVQSPGGLSDYIKDFFKNLKK